METEKLEELNKHLEIYNAVLKIVNKHLHGFASPEVAMQEIVETLMKGNSNGKD